MIDVILTDIEGTTSSIRFVKDVLFPYASAHVGAFVQRNAQVPEVKLWLDRVREEIGAPADDTDAVIATLRQWIVEDRKHTALKALQGMIWKDGYERGEYRAHLYPEVAAKLRAWKAQGRDLYVYSSGSVAAQKLFFGFSEAGDLLPLFSGYFDTEVGGKREAASYARIAQAIGEPAANILFLSDIREEIDAARDAGMAVTWIRREAPLCPADSPVPCVADFDAIRL